MGNRSSTTGTSTLILKMGGAATQVSLKLLVDTQGQRVLFAEADKKAMDFLFHILTLPMATIIRLVSKQKMVGGIANLYESIENLNENYILTNQTKDTLLKPRAPAGFSSPLLALPQDVHGQPPPKEFYRCGNNYCSRFSDGPGARCPTCSGSMSTKMVYVAPPATEGGAANTAGDGGFVKGVVTYMVMDDLVVQPMSTISSITMLNKFNVKEVGALEEKVVDLGISEALNLLKTSLASKKVLTTVFLQNIRGK